MSRWQCRGVPCAGEWVDDKRHGEGTCRFADGTLFEGLWQGDQWLQTDADPGHSQVRGRGLGIAVAGQDTSFRIHVRPSNHPLLSCGRLQCLGRALCGH